MDSDWMDAATCADQRFDRVLANAKACTDWEQLDQAFNVKLEDTGNQSGQYTAEPVPILYFR